MLELEASQDQFQWILQSPLFRLWVYHANCFWENTSKNANLSLGAAMGFSQSVHLIMKPKTLQFWVMIIIVYTHREKEMCIEHIFCMHSMWCVIDMWLQVESYIDYV